MLINCKPKTTIPKYLSVLFWNIDMNNPKIEPNPIKFLIIFSESDFLYFC
jgi:hypothetical protein